MRKSIFALIFFWLAACSAGPTPQVATPPSGNGGVNSPGLTQPAAQPSPTLTSEATPPWAGRIYTGRLILILYGEKGNTLVELDLDSGISTTLYQAPENSWLAAAVVSPDHQQIILAYAPPPPNEEPNYGYSDFYLMPISGGSPPQPFLTRKDPQESYFNPSWAPDGKSIFYTHLYRIDPNSDVPAFQNDVEQVSLDGQTKSLIQHSLWPVPSPDGSKLAYLNEDPITFGNDLYLANADGSATAPVLQPGMNPPIDDHFFTVDGAQLVFSMVNPQAAPTSSWLEKLFGVEAASAHTVPSDWYIVSTGGGQPQRLTDLNDIGMYGDLSPDGQQMAFISATGLYILNMDGSDLFALSTKVYIGTVDWIP